MSGDDQIEVEEYPDSPEDVEGQDDGQDPDEPADDESFIGDDELDDVLDDEDEDA